jgi:hypothetical protein
MFVIQYKRFGFGSTQHIVTPVQYITEQYKRIKPGFTLWFTVSHENESFNVLTIIRRNPGWFLAFLLAGYGESHKFVCGDHMFCAGTGAFFSPLFLEGVEATKPAPRARGLAFNSLSGLVQTSEKRFTVYTEFNLLSRVNSFSGFSTFLSCVFLVPFWLRRFSVLGVLFHLRVASYWLLSVKYSRNNWCLGLSRITCWHGISLTNMQV